MVTSMSRSKPIMTETIDSEKYRPSPVQIKACRDRDMMHNLREVSACFWQSLCRSCRCIASRDATCEKIVKCQNVSDETLIAHHDAKDPVMKQ
jgi:hypothetical protein